VILELVVAPNDTEVGLKVIEGMTSPAKFVDHRLSMLIGMGLALVRVPLPAHGLRPTLRRAQTVR
jgi:hypothetical protein